jgi:hypothetical protein
VTPISASKHHLDLAQVQRALALPRAAHTLAYLASRVGFFREPRTFQVGDVDLAVCSADKHVAGPTVPISWPGWFLSLVSSSARLPRISVEFCQSARSSVVETTTFWMPFMWSAGGSVCAGQKAANSS